MRRSGVARCRFHYCPHLGAHLGHRGKVDHLRGAAPAWDLPNIPELDNPGYIDPQRGEWPAPMIPTGACPADGIWWHVNMGKGAILIEQASPALQVVRLTRGPVVTTMISYPTPVSKGRSQFYVS